VGTLILTSAALVVTVAAAFVSFEVLEVQSQMAEYENAKVALLGMAELIEGLSQSEGSAGYGRMYVRAGGLDIVNDQVAFTLRVGGWTAIDALPFVTMRFRAGRLVGGLDFSVLRGDTGSTPQGTLVVPPSLPGVPLGWVYVQRQEGARVLVDFGRVRVNIIGTYNLSTGTGWEPTNVVEIVFIRLKQGPTYGRDVFDVRAQNKRITLTSNKLPGYTFEILAARGSDSQTYDLVCPDSLNGVPVTSTVFNVVVAEVEVGTQ